MSQDKQFKRTNVSCLRIKKNSCHLWFQNHLIITFNNKGVIVTQSHKRQKGSLQFKSFNGIAHI